jgi:peptide/nickel transport system permease protein
VLADIRARYNLDDPFLIAYGKWLAGVVQGDLGMSIRFGVPVSSLLGPRALTSFMLAGYSSLLILAVGIALGIVAGLKGGILDRAIIVATTIGQAVPSYVAAIFLVALFAVQLKLFPVAGTGDGFADRVWHLTLPAVAMALLLISVVTRVARSAVREEADSEHVETARSRGIPERLVRRRHIVRNAMIPIVTVSGLVVASQISGTIVVETAFAINGLGSYLVQSVQQRDFAVVQAITLILVMVFIVANTVVDALYGVLDPRVRRLSRARG